MLTGNILKPTQKTSKLMENAFKWRHYEGTIILLCVRWYLRYALSYRDLGEMMSERGLNVVHTTIFRWVQHFAPELDRRSRPHLKASNDSWRVDETYIKGFCCKKSEEMYVGAENVIKVSC